MVNCCVPFCKSRRNNPNTKGIRFHEIPSLSSVREKWLEVISREGPAEGSKWIPTDYSRVCSLHFRREDYRENVKIKILKPGVVPSIFPHPITVRNIKQRKKPATWGNNVKITASEGNCGSSCDIKRMESSHMGIEDPVSALALCHTELHSQDVKDEPVPIALAEIKTEPQDVMCEEAEEIYKHKYSSPPIEYVDVKEEHAEETEAVDVERKDSGEIGLRTVIEQDEDVLFVENHMTLQLCASNNMICDIEKSAINQRSTKDDVNKSSDKCHSQGCTFSETEHSVICHNESFLLQDNINICSIKPSRPFSCFMCGKSFILKGALTKHMTIHSGDRYPCEICGKSFTQKAYLQIHMPVHTGNKFSCEVCGKTFSQKRYLKTHIHIHTGDHFSCQQCGKSFSDKERLNNHLESHAEYMPFSCEVCGKSFPHKGGINRHSRIHTGDCPFECEVCGKSFTQKCTLSRHIRMHTGDRPYSCEVCGRSFTRKDRLEKHNYSHR